MTVSYIEADKILWALIRSLGSQTKVAKALGQSRSTVSRWVTHDRGISRDQLNAMKLLLEKEQKKLSHYTVSGGSEKNVKSCMIGGHVSISNPSLKISDRITLAMRYEALAGNRRGRPNNNQQPEVCESSLFYDYQPVDNPQKLTEAKNTKIRHHGDEFSLDKNKIKNLKGRFDDFIAKEFGFKSRKTYRFAKQIIQNGIPELIQAIDDERISIRLGALIVKLPKAEQQMLMSKNSKEINRYLKHKTLKQAKTENQHEINRVISISGLQINTLSTAQNKYQLPLRAAFTTLLTCCDASGEFPWHPQALKEQILPYSPWDFSMLLKALCECGCIEKTVHDGKVYGRVITPRKTVCEMKLSKAINK